MATCPRLGPRGKVRPRAFGGSLNLQTSWLRGSCARKTRRRTSCSRSKRVSSRKKLKRRKKRRLGLTRRCRPRSGVVEGRPTSGQGDLCCGDALPSNLVVKFLAGRGGRGGVRIRGCWRVGRLVGGVYPDGISDLWVRSTTGLVTKNSASGSRGKWWCSSSNAFGQWRRLTPSCPKCPRARGRPRRLWNPRAHQKSDGKPAARDRNQQQDPYRWKCSQWVWARPEPQGQQWCCFCQTSLRKLPQRRALCATELRARSRQYGRMRSSLRPAGLHEGLWLLGTGAPGACRQKKGAFCTISRPIVRT